MAAHELAHQILPHHDLHASRDPSSYDSGAVNRSTQFFGGTHWDGAGPRLEATLGLRPPPEPR